jgi:hypothetical protein
MTRLNPAEIISDGEPMLLDPKDKTLLRFVRSTSILRKFRKVYLRTM